MQPRVCHFQGPSASVSALSSVRRSSTRAPRLFRGDFMLSQQPQYLFTEQFWPTVCKAVAVLPCRAVDPALPVAPPPHQIGQSIPQHFRDWGFQKVESVVFFLETQFPLVVISPILFPHPRILPAGLTQLNIQRIRILTKLTFHPQLFPVGLAATLMTVTEAWASRPPCQQPLDPCSGLIHALIADADLPTLHFLSTVWRSCCRLRPLRTTVRTPLFLRAWHRRSTRCSRSSRDVATV